MQVTTDTHIRTRAADILQALGKGLYERETPIRLAFLTAIAGESIFLLGPPGVGKSLIARRLKFAFRDGTSFEYLMSKFSTPDEIFGPISIKKLKEEDKYERLTDSYLPGANIVFLDEIWKAGPAIQNALLTILNEKVYRNGEQEMQVDIRGIITASNELPPKNRSLEPIWDRFLVRLEIGKIRNFNNLVNMIVSTEDVYEDTLSTELKIGESELAEWTAGIDKIEVPAEVLNTMQLVMVKIEDFNARPNNVDRQLKIYDRRWKKIVRLLRTSAFLNGRDKVDLMDCFLLEHCLWNRPEHREPLRDMITDAIRKHGYSMAINLNALKKEVEEFENDVAEETQIKNVVIEDQLLPVQERFYQLKKENNQFKGELMTIEQFRRLELEKDNVTNYFDGNQNLLNKIKTRKGPRENTIVINFNGTLMTFELETRQNERTEIIYKKPHSVVEKYWDERFKQLTTYVETQQQRIAEHAPSELNQIADNLFVDQGFAKIVSANLEEVKGALQSLELRLEKLRYGYANVG
ncbi:MAG: AAA family ATPase [Saprospiraceae bacterium]